jgi:hypothetical protein
MSNSWATVGLNNKENRSAIGGLHGGRVGDRDEGAASPHDADGACPDIPANYVEHEVYLDRWLAPKNPLRMHT